MKRFTVTAAKRWSLLTLAIAAALPATAHAQSTDCTVGGAFWAVTQTNGYTPQGSDCVATKYSIFPNVYPYGATCWTPSFLVIESGTPNTYLGMPRNYMLQLGPSAGEYPPISYDPHMSTFPLLPYDANQLTPQGFTTRRTIGDAVDATSGAPLLTEIDFEIPFGGAVYRHIRTYSTPQDEFGCWNSVALGLNTIGAGHTGSMHDMVGKGWMLGVNPLFLADARYFPMSNNGGATINDNDRPTCYMMPDAHRTIGFHMIYDSEEEVQPQYAAPLYQDALLDYSEDSVNMATGAVETTTAPQWGMIRDPASPGNAYFGYSPHLGRFLQSDPNATGQELMDRTETPLVSNLDTESLFANGFSLYAPYGANPIAIRNL